MDRKERKEFVRSHRTGVFGYNRKHDGPSMSIVYYMIDGPDDLLISTMAERGKARMVQRTPKVSILVLDEKWPPTYVQVYCDARIDATMESDSERVIDSMMRLYARETQHVLVAALIDAHGRQYRRAHQLDAQVEHLVHALWTGPHGNRQARRASRQYSFWPPRASW